MPTTESTNRWIANYILNLLQSRRLASVFLSRPLQATLSVSGFRNSFLFFPHNRDTNSAGTSILLLSLLSTLHTEPGAPPQPQSFRNDLRSNLSQKDMSSMTGDQPNILEAVNGSHLNWSDFRDNVLQSFRIRCSPKPRSERLPTTFLARLQASQREADRFNDQALAWRTDAVEGRGMHDLPIIPPNLLPYVTEGSSIRRITSPRIGRESLPLRVPSPRTSLYELPTAKPALVCGFSGDNFDKAEHSQLAASLQANGTVVDFSRGEVLPNKTIAIPFLAFHRSDTETESDLEHARNACAISGAQFLRAQQQLFHKAYGLQQLSDPPLTFTSVLSNRSAILNCHYVDDDGNFTMSPMCKFNLTQLNHIKEFLSWIDAIESWAAVYLLPRSKGAIQQILRSAPSPPPSPPPTTSSSLCIDTSSDNVPAILTALRRLWPMVRWKGDIIGETPINSSIAQCGTPFNTRQFRATILHDNPTMQHLPLSARPLDIRPHSSISQRFPELPSLRIDIPQSARPGSRGSIHYRRFSNSPRPSSSDDSTTPVSACRPPSLSPCSPGPEAPVSAKSPILVLQKRLDLAMDEIETLRDEVASLQGQLEGRTEVLERRLEIIAERQEEALTRAEARGTSSEKGGGWVKNLESLVHDQHTLEGYWNLCLTPLSMSPDDASSLESFTGKNIMPGTYPDDPEQLCEDVVSREAIVWFLAVMLKDAKGIAVVLATAVVIMLVCGAMRGSELVVVALFLLTSHERTLNIAQRGVRSTLAFTQAVIDYDLDACRPLA